MKKLNFLTLILANISIFSFVGFFAFSHLKKLSWFVGNENILLFLIVVILLPIMIFLSRLDYKNYLLKD